jgi:hypothetical protein
MKFAGILAAGLVVSVAATCLQAQIVVQAAGGDAGAPPAVYSFSSEGLATPMGFSPMMGPGSYIPSDTMGMLRMPQFEKELELLEDQIAKKPDYQSIFSRYRPASETKKKE